MQLKIRNPEDFWAGLLFIAFGVVAMWVSRDYPMGSAMRMGPGYFPTVLGGLMAVMGAIVSLLSLRTQGPPLRAFPWKATIMLTIGFSIFGWGIDHVGFVPALFGCIVLCAAAGQIFKWRDVLIMSAVLIAGSVAVFIYGIELPYPLFWWR
ncbi:MAG TPA: tripartite tricarboxylate transporter TctB family protein [Burkholderiales bacterium]|nr:tripartite tricarboxylate transporter TctB family protein [Burkholderiales bacterium]